MRPSQCPQRMTELVYTEQALRDLERHSDFLLATDPQAAQDTAVLIFDALEILVLHPEIGRKVHFGQRELVISRGRTGYLALYRFLPHIDRILVLALRHQRESGYKGMWPDAETVIVSAKQFSALQAATQTDTLAQRKTQFEQSHRAWITEQNQRFEAHGLWCDDMRVW